MTLRIPAKVLIHVWSYDFYDMTLSTGKQRRHMIKAIKRFVRHCSLRKLILFAKEKSCIEAFLIKTITHRFEIGPNRFCLNDKNCQDLYDRKTNTVRDCVPINK